MKRGNGSDSAPSQENPAKVVRRRRRRHRPSCPVCVGKKKIKKKNKRTRRETMNALAFSRNETKCSPMMKCTRDVKKTSDCWPETNDNCPDFRLK